MATVTEAVRPRSAVNTGTKSTTDAGAGEKTSTTFGLLPVEWELLTLSTSLKLLLFPAYHSTDFEVHRNWLAITKTLPIREWYFEHTSQWTFDYPPFFGYFSWLLAQPAVLVDPLIVSLHEGLEYSAWSCKVYMRATVVVTELVLAAALVAHARVGSRRKTKLGLAGEDTSTQQLLGASLLVHPGLIIIDHIHFQYNGFLFGVLAWSLWAAREDRPLLCAFLFSSLLNLKHIYVYVAPPFLIFLLRSYVFPVGSTASDLGRSFERLLTVGVVTLIPFFLSLAPLAIDGLRHEAGPIGVVSQMVKRLFPFSRGLIHAYWAPNAWALWTVTDRVLVKLILRIPALRMLLPTSFLARYDASSSSGFASASRGLVENISFGVLPEITPGTCFAITLACVAVYMVKLWQTPTYRSFLAAVSLCGFASFLFGWHVHEKAIMLPLIPYTFLAMESYAHYRTFVLLSTAGVVSLFPLLFRMEEGPIKIGYSSVWGMVVFGMLGRRVYREVQGNVGILVHALETVYLWGFVGLQVYVSIVHPMVFARGGDAVALKAETVMPTSFANTTSIAAPAVPAPTAAVEEAISAAPSIASSIGSTEEAHTFLSSEVDAVSAEPTIAVSTAEFDAPQPSPSGSGDLLSVPATVSTDEAASVTRASATPEAHRKDQEKTANASTSSTMEFLPLMMVSVYCSIGVIWAWIRASALYLLSES